MRKPIIGVMGGTVCDQHTAALAFQVGRLIAEGGAMLLCGGGQGVMQAVCQGAKSADGLVIGIMPGSNEIESPPNEFVDIALFTGMSDARNTINAKSSDVVIAIAGEFGTLSEIALALKAGKPVIALHSWDIAKSGKIPPNYVTASDPEDAVQKAFQALEMVDS